MPSQPPHDDGTFKDGPKSAAAVQTQHAPFLFLLFECERPLAGGARYSLGAADEVLLGRATARTVARAIESGVRRLAIGVPDRRLSSTHARIVRRGEALVVEDAGSTNGSLLNGEALRAPTELQDGDVLELGRTLFLYRASLPVRVGQAAELDAAELTKSSPVGMRTLLPSYALDLEALRKVARSELPILLLGETGTGKEVVARAAHGLSGRTGPFVAVNCGALPDTLVESQLFGHVRGSFSGAVRDEVGFVRAAHRGTLFLDEIGDLSKPSQAAFLRVIQEREVTPVGSTQSIKVDLRIIAATHAPLERDAATGEFRSDLFARLAGMIHALVPLRARLPDLGLLMADILAGIGSADTLTFSPEAARALVAHPFPRNLRELQQTLSLATVLAAPGTRIETWHLPPAVTSVPASSPADRASSETEADDELRRALVALLQQHQGNVAEVARVMGKGRNQIHRWMKRFAIDPTIFRG